MAVFLFFSFSIFIVVVGLIYTGLAFRLHFLANRNKAKLETAKKV